MEYDFVNVTDESTFGWCRKFTTWYKLQSLLCVSFSFG